MNDLKILLTKREKLDEQIVEARKIEADTSLAKVRELIDEFGFTAQQVFPWKGPEKRATAKYLDEKTGATWSGHGRPPAWIAGQNREAFLIKKPNSQPQSPFLAEMAAAAHRNRT